MAAQDSSETQRPTGTRGCLPAGRAVGLPRQFLPLANDTRQDVSSVTRQDRVAFLQKGEEEEEEAVGGGT